MKAIVALVTIFASLHAAGAERVIPLWMSGLRVGSELVATRENVEESFVTVGKGPPVSLHVLADSRGAVVARWGRDWPWIEGNGPLPVSRLAALARSGEASASCGNDALGACHRFDDLVWGSCFVWLDARGALRAAMVPNAIAPLIASSAADRELVLRLSARYAVRALQEKVDAARISSARTIVIRGASIVDEAGKRDGTIVIEGDRIRAVGREVTIPADAHVIDAPGATVLPGLWDTHAHMKVASWGPAYLAVGVTSVRDVGMDDAYVTELRRGFRRRGGAGPATRLAAFVDAAAERPHTAVQANTPAEARARVRQFHARGYEQMKVWQHVQPDVVRELAREAHRLGMTLTGHVPAAMNAYEAVEAGFDQINHSDALVATAGDDPATLARWLRERGVVVEPTLVVAEFHYRNVGLPLSTLEPALHRVAPDIQRANEGLHPMQGDRAAGEAAFRRALALVRALREAGVTLLAGTDQGVPGYSLLREIELMTEAGLTNLEAIRTATSIPARVFGDVDGGNIAAGKRADLLIVDGDPLADIRALRRTRVVIRGGIAYDPAALRRAAGHRE